MSPRSLIPSLVIVVAAMASGCGPEVADNSTSLSTQVRSEPSTTQPTQAPEAAPATTRGPDGDIEQDEPAAAKQDGPCGAQTSRAALEELGERVLNSPLANMASGALFETSAQVDHFGRLVAAEIISVSDIPIADAGLLPDGATEAAGNSVVSQGVAVEVKLPDGEGLVFDLLFALGGPDVLQAIAFELDASDFRALAGACALLFESAGESILGTHRLVGVTTSIDEPLVPFDWQFVKFAQGDEASSALRIQLAGEQKE